MIRKAMSLPNNEKSTPVLYTIGYEGLQQDEFAGILEQHGINTIIDVREIPHSRKKGFSKRHLIALANDKGMRYFSFRSLGSPTPLRQKLRQDGNYGEFAKAYIRHLKEQKRDLDNIVLMTQQESCCLLCYEKNADLCHRKMIASEIASLDHGMEVIHLCQSGSSEKS